MKESALNSTDQRQAACLAAEIRLDSILDSNNFELNMAKKAEVGSHKYLDNHLDKLRELMSAHIETTADTSTTLAMLIANSARREVDHYF